MPKPDTTQSTTVATPVTARTMRPNSARPFRSRYSVKTGMMAVDSAPSARSRRSRFGIRKATKKASVTGPAPKGRAEGSRHDHVAHEPEHPARERGGRDDADGPQDPVLRRGMVLAHGDIALDRREHGT